MGGTFGAGSLITCLLFALKFLLLVTMTSLSPDSRKSDNPKVTALKDLCCLLKQLILMEENQCVGWAASKTELRELLVGVPEGPGCSAQQDDSLVRGTRDHHWCSRAGHMSQSMIWHLPLCF